MTDRAFAAWAATRGVPDGTTEERLEYTASPEEMREAHDAMDPAPPV